VKPQAPVSFGLSVNLMNKVNIGEHRKYRIFTT
jgi:hypothetical protein